MNRVIKIQQDIITAKNPMYAEIDRDRVALAADGSMMVVVLKESCRVDVKKLKKVDATKILKDLENAAPIEKTNDIKEVAVHGALRRFANADGEMWVREKLLKMFGKNLTFKRYRSVLGVYENCFLVGVIMEVKINK